MYVEGEMLPSYSVRNHFAYPLFPGLLFKMFTAIEISSTFPLTSDGVWGELLKMTQINPI